LFFQIDKINNVSKQKTIPIISPIWAYINIFQKDDVKKIIFTKNELKDLIGYGYNINPFSKYPLIKENIYNDSLNLDENITKLNVIIIFTEGLSAVTTSVYNDTFEDLTPNLERFARDNHTTIMTNYYNHTAATYRGLFGQLCSIYPWLGGGKSWIKNDILNLSENSYKCLPHILNHNGYETVYFNMHYKDSSGNDEMAISFGFDKVLSGEELSLEYLGKINKIRDHYIDDQEAYQILIEYLKNKPDSKKPFLLATYTIETHAFVDITKDGIGYKDNTHNVLNTIHNMDDAFGKFWRYFKQSKFSKNTMIIFTSDHAHYYCEEYKHTLEDYKEKNYHNIFIDRVPLLIYNPYSKLPSEFDTKQGTSIDLTPSILNLLKVKQESNSFIGHSLFEQNRKNIGIGSFGNSFYLIKENNLIYGKHNVLQEDKNRFNVIHKFIDYLHELEKENKVFKNDI
jgi:phosphoglycerol transferase MdoB-like AlkP superfamily enzyme